VSKLGIDPNKFNNFFIEKVALIRVKIRDTLASLDLSEFPILSATVPSSMNHFSPISLEDVFEVIRSIPGKSSSRDDLPTFLLKEMVDTFVGPILHLCNMGSTYAMSFNSSTFPASLKTGCITPLLKKPGMDPSDLSSYRPITSLSTLSKIIERLALRQLRPKICGSPHFPEMQSAYRTAHSTETALLKVTSDIYGNMEFKTTSCLLSLDISAAFDALDHDILLGRAETLFGISGSALLWLRSYLTGRTAITRVDGAESDPLPLTTGVPHGSTLGPLLFALYVAPLGSLTAGANTSFHQYADDTQLYIALSPVDESLATLTHCSDQVNSWFLQNYLMLNTSKTETILFGTSYQLRNLSLRECVPFTHSEPILFSDKILSVRCHIRSSSQYGGARHRGN
jgi:hypothetical protein